MWAWARILTEVMVSGWATSFSQMSHEVSMMSP